MGSSGRLSEVDFHFWGDGLHLKARARLSPGTQPVAGAALPARRAKPTGLAARHRL